MRVIRPRVDYDAAHGDTPVCWVCRQVWPDVLSLVLDANDRELRIDGAKPVSVRPSESEVLAVLINCSPRWITRSQLHEYAYAERPDVDMPVQGSLSATLQHIRGKLVGTRYVVESNQSTGVRLVTEEQLARERREYVAQIPVSGKQPNIDMAVVSEIAMAKSPVMSAKPIRYRRESDLEKWRAVRDPEGVTKKSWRGKKTPPLAKGSPINKSRHRKKAKDVKNVRPH